MKIGGEVWVRVGREKTVMVGRILDANLPADKITVELCGGFGTVERSLKRVYHNQPKHKKRK